MTNVSILLSPVNGADIQSKSAHEGTPHVTSVKPEQPMKAQKSTVVTVWGMVSCVSDAQL